MNRLAAAAAVMTLSVLMFSFVEVFIKRIGGAVPLHQIITYRVVLSLPIIVYFLWRGRQSFTFRTKVPGMHLLRFFFGLTSMICIFYAVTAIPLGTAAAITSTAPLFLLLIAPVFLSEKVPVLGWTGAAIGFFGVVLVSTPQATTNSLGVVSAILGAFLTAGVMVTLRILGRTESASVSSFFNTIGMCVACLVAVVWLGWTPLESQHYWDVILLGTAGGAAQLLNTWAYKHGRASALAPLEFTASFWGPLLGYLIWNELQPPYAIFGIAAIIVGGVIAVTAKEKTHD